MRCQRHLELLLHRHDWITLNWTGQNTIWLFDVRSNIAPSQLQLAHVVAKNSKVKCIKKTKNVKVKNVVEDTAYRSTSATSSKPAGRGWWLISGGHYSPTGRETQFCTCTSICRRFGLTALEFRQDAWDQKWSLWAIHRVTVTWFRSIPMLAGFRRHLVGKTLRNVCHCDSA